MDLAHILFAASCSIALLEPIEFYAQSSFSLQHLISSSVTYPSCFFEGTPLTKKQIYWSNIMLYLNYIFISNNSKFNIEIYMDTYDPIRSGRTAQSGKKEWSYIRVNRNTILWSEYNSMRNRRGGVVRYNWHVYTYSDWFGVGAATF